VHLLLFFLFISLFLASFAMSFWQRTVLFLETGDAIIKKERDIKLLEGALSYAYAQYRQDVALQQLVASSRSTITRPARWAPMQKSGKEAGRVIEQRYCLVERGRVEISVVLLVNGKEQGRLRSLQPLFAVY
jgi:hypothetical protein